MLNTLYRSLVATLFLATILCGLYPLLVTAFGKAFFSSDASGGIIALPDGRRVGARLIGQAFTRPEYFHGRPSSAGSGYDAANSSGSNLGPTHPKLIATIHAQVETVLKENPTLKKGEIPTDLVTSSGSGLDPHLSPKAAYVQVARVAEARGITTKEVIDLVEGRIEGPQFGILGPPVINVLLLNLELDRLYPTARHSASH